MIGRSPAPSDAEMAVLLRAWLRSGVAELPDGAELPAAVRDEVLRRLDDMPQHRRRWLGRWFRGPRGATRDARDRPRDTTRRDRLMFAATAAAGVVTLALAATLIVPGLVGPNPAPAAPASPAPSATPGPGPDALFTGDLLFLSQDDSMVEETDHGVRGLKETYTLWFSDPRLPTEGRGVVNIDTYDVGGAVSGVRLLEGPEGYWTGPFTSYCAWASRVTCRGIAVLTGHGAYEGLTAVIANSPAARAGAPSAVLEEWTGLIFPADEMPPMPELLEPTAE